MKKISIEIDTTEQSKNLTTTLSISNDPIMRVTLRYFDPLKIEKSYYERDMNEMLDNQQSTYEFTDNFIGRVRIIIIYNSNLFKKKSTLKNYQYIQPSSAKAIQTSYEQGGFSFYLYRNETNFTGFIAFFRQDDIINAFVK